MPPGRARKIYRQNYIDAVADDLLVVYKPGSNVSYKSTKAIRVFYEEAHWDDLNNWLETYLPRINFKFPAPTEITYSSAKPSNGPPFSNHPRRQDEWYKLIEAMMYEHQNEHRRFPDRTQAWSRLWNSLPKEFGVTTGKDEGGEEALFMGGKSLSNSAFKKRFDRCQ